MLRLSNRGGGKVDNEIFSLELLQMLVKGDKEAQTITIGAKSKESSKQNEANKEMKEESPAANMGDNAAIEALAAELVLTSV